MNRFGLVCSLSLVALGLAACEPGGSGPVDAGTTPAPVVVSTTPPDGATGVAPDAVVTVLFDQPMKGASISAETFIVEGAAGTVTYDDGSRSATFRASQPFSRGRVVSVRLTTDLQSALGASLKGEHRFSFTIAATDPEPPALQVVSTSPAADATGVSVGATISVTFDQEVQRTSLTSAIFALSSGAGAVVPTRFTYDAASRTASLTPTAALAASTTFTATISGVTAVSGAGMARPHSWSFTTGADAEGPRVVATYPLNGAQAIGPLTPVTVTFDELLDLATLTATTFTVCGTSGAIAWDAHSRSATYTPSTPMATGVVCVVELTNGITDTGGNPLAAHYRFSFNVAPDTTGPRVVATSPSGGEFEWSAGPHILSATFDEPIKVSTLSGNFYVQAVGSTQRLWATYSYVPATRTASLSIDPNGYYPLRLGFSYTVTLTSSIEDVAGNRLGAFSFGFKVVDTRGPSVTGSSPKPTDRFLGASTQPTLTFSEPIDCATAEGAIQIEGAAATFQCWSSTVQVKPAQPLALGTTYKVTVGTSLKDPAGHALVEPFEFSFRTVDPPTTLSARTRSPKSDPRIVYAANGDAMAAWIERTREGSTGVAVGSRYEAATDTWQAPEVLGRASDFVLAAGPDAQFAVGMVADSSYGSSMRVYKAGSWSPPKQTSRYVYKMEVAANAEGFLFGYADGALQVQRWNGTGFDAELEAVADIDSYRGEWELIGVGSDFLIVAGDATLKARLLAGTSLGAETLLATAPTNYAITNLVSAGTAAGVAVGYEISSNYTANVSTSYGRIYSAGAWSAEKALLAETGGSHQLALVSDGVDEVLYLARRYYGTAPISAWHYAFSTGAWGVQEAAGPSFTGWMGPAAGGAAGFAVTWDEAGAFIVERSAAGWSAPHQYDDSATTWDGVLPTGDGFAVACVADGTLKEAHSTAGAWSETLTLETGLASPPELTAALDTSRRPVIAFIRDAAVQVRGLDGTSPTKQLLSGVAGEARNVRLEVNAAGQALVVWEQQDAGAIGVYASAFDGTRWSAATVLDPGGTTPAVATDGTRFVVAYRTAGGVATRLWTTGPQPAVTVDPAAGATGAIALASNGTDWLLAYATASGGVSGHVSADPAGWGAAVELGGDSEAKRIRVASDGRGFGIVCDLSTGGRVVVRAYANGAWQAAESFAIAQSRSDFTGGSAGYALAWGYGTTGYGGRVSTWTPSTNDWVESSFLVNIDSAGTILLGPEGDGFFMVIESSMSRSMRFSNGAWSEPVSAKPGIIFSSSGADLVAGTNGFGLFTSDGGASFIPAGSSNASTSGRFASGSDVTVRPAGATFSAAWLEQDPMGAVVVRVATGL